jgi:hypothetical protein
MLQCNPTLQLDASQISVPHECVIILGDRIKALLGPNLACDEGGGVHEDLAYLLYYILYYIVLYLYVILVDFFFWGGDLHYLNFAHKVVTSFLYRIKIRTKCHRNMHQRRHVLQHCHEFHLNARIIYMNMRLTTPDMVSNHRLKLQPSLCSCTHRTRLLID